MATPSETVPKSETEQEDEWIVQAKPSRRLVPQHSLSRQDLDADASKNKVAAAAVAAVVPDPKKKGSSAHFVKLFIFAGIF